MSDKAIYAVTNITSNGIINNEIRTELFRKGIHLMVALVPMFAAISLTATQIFLIAAIVFYSFCETLRLSGRKVILVSNITSRASRHRDKGQFVMGPVTLALGALLALMLYPSEAAAIGIYALAFGDTAAAIVGKFFGKIEIPGVQKKTLEGFFACFVSVFFVTYAVLADLKTAIIIAFTASVVELVPIKDLDNIMIPLAVGMLAMFVI